MFGTIPRRSVIVVAEIDRSRFGVERRGAPDRARAGAILIGSGPPRSVDAHRWRIALRFRPDIVFPDDLSCLRIEGDHKAAAAARWVKRNHVAKDLFKR